VLTLRAATVDDAAAIGRVHVRGWQWAYRDILPGAGFARLPEDTMAERWRAQLSGPAAELRTWVAELDGSVAGFCVTSPCRDGDAEPGWMEVQAVYLAAEDLTGRGIGRALMDRALDDLRERGTGTVTLWVLRDNARARRFYAAAGFATDGAEKVDVDGDGVRYEEVRYRRSL
jgi:ribosomal protein S18 acetylase RimI-like enzyme